MPLGGGDAITFAGTDTDERSARLSPDGKWMAYVSLESGRPEVFVQPFPATGAKWQVSRDGGQQPQWQQDGRQLYYLAAGRKLIAVDVITKDGTFSTGTSYPLVDTRITGGERGGQGCQYAVTRDGTRFHRRHRHRHCGAGGGDAELDGAGELTRSGSSGSANLGPRFDASADGHFR